MGIPQAVQNQLDEADRFLQEMDGASGEEFPEGEPLPEGEETAEAPEPPVEPPAEPVAEPEQGAPLKAKPGREEDPFYWRDRATAIHGINLAQTTELREARKREQALMEQISQLRAQQVAPRPDEPDVAAEEVANFGQDMVGMVDRRTKAITEQAEKSAREELGKVLSKFEQRLDAWTPKVDAAGDLQFFGALEKLIPDYETINASPAWLRWLGEKDPVSGVMRQTALEMAHDYGDVEHVAAIFNAFTGGRSAPSTPAVSRSEKLAGQLSPGTTRTGAQPPAFAASKDTRLWSDVDFRRAYDPRNARVLGEKRASELLAAADLALSEGRVQGG